ncbi:MAG: carboxypeptidase-like regulatory domain-containing protein [Planctomycetota bacterium]
MELGPLYLDRAPGLTFQVLDARTGKPIPRAKVSLTGSSEGLLDELEEGEEGPDLDGVVANADAASHKRTAGQTDREGKVRLTLFRAETATLNVRASRYADFTERNFVMEGGEKEYVVRMTQGSTLEFEVVDVNGLAVPSAMIYAKDGNPFRAMNADKNGRKRRTKVRAGTYFFAAQRVMNGMGRWGGGQQGDELAWQEFLVKEGETLQVQLILPAQMRMRGRVYADGQPLEGASVAARPIRGEERDARWMDATDDFRFMDATQTDAEGRFVIEGLEEGPYVLRVRHAEWAMTHQEKIQVVDGGEEITVVMPRTSIAGLITDQNGKPVEGAEVVAESAPSSDEEGAARSFMRGFMGSNGPSARTNAAGEFLLKGVAPERPVRLRVQARGFVARYSETFEVGRNELRGGTNVRLEPGGDISVTVVSDEPASGVRIVVATYTGEASPKPEDETVFLKGGRGSLKGLHPGPWKLSLTARGVGGVELGEPSEPITVNVEAGGQHEARFAQE